VTASLLSSFLSELQRTRSMHRSAPPPCRSP